MALINLRNALMAGKRLPYDAEVEYLQSTGTQWINTGYYPNNNTKLQYRCISASNGTACGCMNGTGWNPSFSLVFYTGVSPRWGTNAITSYTPFTWANVDITVEQDKDCYLNGRLVRSYTDTQFQMQYPLIVFDRSELNNNHDPYEGKVYYLKIFENGTLVRDFIPVRKGTTGELYDRVSGKFAERHGDFVLGQDVVPVEYIESHGTERIDTGFKADNTCKFRIDMERRGGSDYWLFGSRNGTSTATDKSCLFASVNSSVGYAMMGSAAPSYNSMLIKDGKHMLEMSLADGFVIDGDVSATYTASEQAEVFTNSYPMSIFTMYNGSMYFNAFTGRVYLFSITSGGVSRLNLLPVRVGTEGAMMDTLTRRIYRNAGTGAFSYGNDLKYPIPAS